MVSTHVPVSDAGSDMGYTDRSHNSNAQPPPNLSEPHTSTHPVSQPPRFQSPRNEKADGATSSPLASPEHIALPQIPPADGYENTADIWADRVNNDLRIYSPPKEPFSHQVTGKTNPGSLRDLPPSGVQLGSNNPFLKAKLSRDQNLNTESNSLEEQTLHPTHGDQNTSHYSQPPDSSQMNNGMAALSLTPLANHTDSSENIKYTTVGEGANLVEKTGISDESSAAQKVVSPTESENLIDFDSHENSVEGEPRSGLHTPSESSVEKIDKGKGVVTQDIEPEPRAASPAGVPPVPAVVEPSSVPNHTTPVQSSQHASHKSEIYDIRSVSWTDGTTELRQSPVLVQNENGPCPLLALVNSLVLRSPLGAKTPLIRALHSRERISLGLLIQALFDELISSSDGSEELPDIEALSVFLTMLHTGMNVNPRLTPILHPPTPGTFLKTRDIELYSVFNLPLVHGWAAAPSSPTHEALLRVAEYHDDIQLLHFQREDLESRAIRTGSLTLDEQRLFEDIDTIQRFVAIDNPTHLSPFGLQHLEKSLPSGSICVLFRNDHFSTLFKHPLSNQLFTLVTDAGYASHAEIVWESLVDVNGTNSELYSGDFRPVGHGPSAHVQPTLPSEGGLPVKDSTNTTEQTDADYAFALSLQYEDEQNRQDEPRSPPPARRPQNNLRINSETTLPRGRSHHQIRSTRSASFTQPSPALPSTLTPLPRTPTTHRPPPSRTQAFSPMIPPTSGQSDNDNDPNAPPPTYEQAAQEPAYIPPHNGHPYPQQHQGYMGPNSRYNQMPGYNQGPHVAGRRRQGPASLSTSSLPQRDYYRERDRNKDCIVM
ncbi:hypothetical protein MferCBS31731_003364 [Microsporum ferrugineum]